MTKRILQLSMIVCLLSCRLWAADDPMTGTWKMNPSRSKLTDQMKVKAVGENKYALTFSGDNVETVVADGTDQPAMFDTTLAITADKPGTWKVVRKAKGRIEIIGIWTLSADGSTLTDDYTGYRPDGSTSNLHYIYQRTAGTAGFPGTWESVTEDVNSSFVIEIKPFKDSGLSFVYPGGGMTKNMKFDGKQYPASGQDVPAGYTASATQTGAHAFEMTDRVDGKVFDTQIVELSADGQTLTMTVSHKGDSKPDIMVFDRQ